MNRYGRTRGGAGTAAMVGLLSLASAMGIGRFAFTPLLPLMQGAAGITLAQGARLAAANYLGYLVGALASYAFAIEASAAARWGLVAVAASTLASAFAPSIPAWFVLRFAAGVASALVLVGASAWTLSSLARHQQLRRSGWAFAGVGIGIFVAGITALVIASLGAPAPWAWGALGALAAAVAALAWRPLAAPAAGAAAPPSHQRHRPGRADWILIGCYGVFGFGYILPATFIPAAARAIVAEPGRFAWAWPLFGLAAAVSTIAASRLSALARPRTVAALSFIVMAIGVGLSAAGRGLGTLCLAAICVGGTFMVATMACLQEARRIRADAPDRLIAAMTAAFALGQLAGPLTVRATGPIDRAIAAPSAAAAALLLLAGLVLLVQRAPARAAPASPLPAGAGDDRTR